MITQGFQQFSAVKGSTETLKNGKSFLTNLSEGKKGDFGAVFSKLVEGELNSGDVDLFQNLRFFDANSIIGKKEVSLINLLASGIKTNGKMPTELQIDSKGLNLFEDLLKSLGFGDEVLATFMAELTQNGSKETISLSTLMKKTNEFLSSGTSHDELDMAATPYIESMLITLGVSQKEAEAVTIKSRGKNAGIDVQKLIDNLNTLVSQQSDSKTVDVSQLNTAESRLLQSLDVQTDKLFPSLDVQTDKKGYVTLSDFIRGLEQLVNKNINKNMKHEDPGDIAKKFGKSIIDSSDHGKNIFQTQADNNSFLNNHSFQKHQQMMEDKFGMEQFADQKGTKIKHSDVKFSIKGAASFLDNETIPNELSGKKEEGFRQLLKTTTHTEAMINKTSNGIRLTADKTIPSYVTHQVSQKIIHAVNHGESEFKLQIKPPEMGRLQISLEFTKSGLRIGILAENSATREMLFANTGELKSILADQGIRLDKVQVDVSGNFDQSMADTRQGSKESSNKNNGSQENDYLYESIARNETETIPKDIYLRPETGRLNLIV